MELQEFDDLINLGKVTRKVKILNHEIVLETVSSGDYAQAMANVPDNMPESKRYESIQREMVGAAIRTIDGKTISQEGKQRLMTSSQLGLSNILYGEYLKMVDEQARLLDDAKKNSLEAEKTLTTSPKA